MLHLQLLCFAIEIVGVLITVIHLKPVLVIVECLVTIAEWELDFDEGITRDVVIQLELKLKSGATVTWVALASDVLDLLNVFRRLV